MRLLKQLIEKNLELSEEFMLRRNYKRAVVFFYGAVNISNALNEIVDPKKNKKNKFFKKVNLSGNPSEKTYNKLKNYMKKDMKNISNAFNLIEAEYDKQSESYSETWDEDNNAVIGILSFEHFNR
jgi:hypothetical protein